MIALVLLAALAAGYGLGRGRPAYHLAEWATWQRLARPVGWRRRAVWLVLSADNLTWIAIHPRRARLAPPPRPAAPARPRTRPSPSRRPQGAEPMTPAETLTAAATRLRDLTAAISPPDERDLPFHAEGTEVTQGRGLVYDVAEAQTPELAVYIAAMHPGVGLMVAELLDANARFASLHAQLYAAELGQQITEYDHTVRAALAVAEKIVSGDR
ncbi:hypothetical protein [Streptomyces sp. CA-253872]|uniref:hypothetical protein n=1 Tax=Streptomyces sp. CA-253872 TaxID=3240067 RepID=UPI003D93F68D